VAQRGDPGATLGGQTWRGDLFHIRVQDTILHQRTSGSRRNVEAFLFLYPRRNAWERGWLRRVLSSGSVFLYGERLPGREGGSEHMFLDSRTGCPHIKAAALFEGAEPWLNSMQLCPERANQRACRRSQSTAPKYNVGILIPFLRGIIFYLCLLTAKKYVSHPFTSCLCLAF
jgi:hypothetical protein